MKVLGLDPGQKTGWAVVNVDRNGQELLEYGVIELGGLVIPPMVFQEPALLDPELVAVELPDEEWARYNIRAVVRTAFIAGQLYDRARGFFGNVVHYTQSEWACGVAQFRHSYVVPSDEERWAAFFAWFPEAHEKFPPSKRGKRKEMGLPEGKHDHVRDAALLALYAGRRYGL